MGINTIESPLGVRWSSLAMAAAIVLVVGVIHRRPLLAVVTAMAWGTTYEVVYEMAKILVHPDAHFLRTLALTNWWLLTIVGWSVASYLSGVRPHLTWLGISALIFWAWLVLGYGWNTAGQTAPVDWGWEALNVGSKTALGVSYLLGALDSDRQALVLGALLGRVLQQQGHSSSEVVG